MMLPSWSEVRERWRTMVERRRDLVGINRRNVTLVYRHNPRKLYPEADDKLLCKQLMEREGVPLARTLAICEGLSQIPDTLESLRELEQFVVKPANASGGEGILVVGERVRDGVWRRAGGEELTLAEMRYRLAEIVFGAYSGDLEDRAFVEERIRPHPVFQAFWGDGLCDIRVITLEHRPVLCMVRVPTRESGGRANLHQGGIGLAVDLESGKTVRAYYRGSAIVTHPESGAPLVDIQLPRWPEVLETAERAARSVRLGYLGVDVVVDAERGCMVLEVNARPGLEIQNVHGHGLGEALRRYGGIA